MCATAALHPDEVRVWIGYTAGPERDIRKPTALESHDNRRHEEGLQRSDPPAFPTIGRSRLAHLATSLEIADAVKFKGLATLPAKADRVSAGSVAARSPASTSPVSSPPPSGTCSPSANPSAPAGPPRDLWSHEMTLD